MRAVDVASVIAERFESELVVITVLGSSNLSPEQEKFARSEELKDPPAELAKRLVGSPLTADAASKASEKGVKKVTKLAEIGDPAEEIIKAAKGLKVDLIVLGTRGLGTMRELLMGSVSHKVTHLSECPCMTVK